MATLTDEEWEAYKMQFNKAYADAEEDAMRRKLVDKNKQFVDEHNKKFQAGETTFECGLNHFSDRTPEENQRRFGLRPPRD
ncbi:digestive cysteine proteinase 2-like [Stomoxys calcitrans]|uniref:Cathepsin propeptide inhibitor domain-containing protein n=1 Tax=Stomoxys calcitrans TaxID=35570 RepID=A0A1I8Q4L2_STOCA|nr:digestive cysteine proteinase 2-like [Stomoxys calcitrans]